MMLRVLVVLSLFAGALTVMLAQAPGPAPEPLTALQVKSMINSGVSDTQVIALIQAAPVGYNLTGPELQDMIYAKVPDRVIEAMYSRKAAAAAAAARGGGGGGNAPTLPAFPADKTDGVFYAKGTAWVPMLEERVTWSQRDGLSTMRKVATVGTMRNPVRGSLTNETSKTLLGNPPAVAINISTGDIHSYHLVTFKVGKGKRTVVVGDATKAAAAHASTDYKIDTAAGGQYKIAMPGGLPPGQYGIYNDRTLAKERIGKIYTFEVQ